MSDNIEDKVRKTNTAAIRENEQWLQRWILSLYRQVKQDVSAQKSLLLKGSVWGEERQNKGFRLEFHPGKAMIFCKTSGGGEISGCCNLADARGRTKVALSPFKSAHATGTKKFAYGFWKIWPLLPGFGHHKENEWAGFRATSYWKK